MVSLLLLALPPARPASIALTPSRSNIQSSVKVKPGTYTLADTDGKGAIQVLADGVTIDFQGATLQSPAMPGGRQEGFEGIGVSVNGHKNVTIKNADIRGYRFNIKATGCRGLRIENCRVSRSRSQKIMDGGSVRYIWLAVRDLPAWRSYGAGAWLEDCTRSRVSGITANQCQNGLILVNSDRNTVVGCDLSYASGWGLAMWSSSDNLVCWNNANFVNRPWGGLWGGDSSGFLLTASCHRNVFAYNSLTHGGDGFFLATRSAGLDAQGVYRTEGTCDHNVVAYNDGSWSPHNSFESTFSTGNVFFRNRCDDSDYGFWLGFSQKNVVRENRIVGSHTDGIAHGQGSDNWYVGNLIQDTRSTAIHVWSDDNATSRQVPSAGNHIVGNTIVRARAAFEFSNSTGYTAIGYTLRDAPIPAGFAPLPANEVVGGYTVPRLAEIRALKPKDFAFYRDTRGPRGCDWLAPTAYGMRDYRGMLVPWMMHDSKTLKLAVDPKRVKRIVLPDWMASRPGAVPGERLVSIKPGVGPSGDYRGFRIQVLGMKGEKQTISGRVLDADWHVRWYRWFRNEHDAYSDRDAWTALFAGPPVFEDVLPALPSIQGYVSPRSGMPGAYFALVAITRIRLRAGAYRFETLSDDGIRVLVDGSLVVDNWTHHAGTNDAGQINLTEGLHDIEVRYCQETGAAALSVHWTREKG